MAVESIERVCNVLSSRKNLHLRSYVVFLSIKGAASMSVYTCCANYINAVLLVFSISLITRFFLLPERKNM
jgi:hypothetical protein